jgi:glycosyltransferase involved in cell wall biosynthesis
MKKIGLSVIIPVYNSESWIKITINHITQALNKTSFKSEIIVVDDGSSDKSAENVAAIKMPTLISIKIIKQDNKGRYLARKIGVKASRYDNILFVDSRVYVDDNSLRFLNDQLKYNSDQIWNGHVNIDKKGNIFARFWDAIVCIAWRKYFRNPKTTSYGIKEYDYFPKGTGFFFVPKKRLLAAMKYFEQTSSDLRHSSDDTLLIRYLAERQDIHLSPEFSCLYHSRSTLVSFLKHTYHRGEFFIDGFLRPGTRFFYPLISALMLCIITVIALLLWPLYSLIIFGLLMALFVLGLFFGSMLLGVVFWDALSLTILSLPFAVIYLIGLWRGVIRKIISL